MTFFILQLHNHGDVKVKLNDLQEKILLQIQENEKILHDLRKLRTETGRVDVVFIDPRSKVKN